MKVDINNTHLVTSNEPSQCSDGNQLLHEVPFQSINIRDNAISSREY